MGLRPLGACVAYQLERIQLIILWITPKHRAFSIIKVEHHMAESESPSMDVLNSTNQHYT